MHVVAADQEGWCHASIGGVLRCGRDFACALRVPLLSNIIDRHWLMIMSGTSLVVVRTEVIESVAKARSVNAIAMTSAAIRVMHNLFL